MLAGIIHRPRPTTPRSIPKTRSAAATWCWKRWTNRATSPKSRCAKARSRRCRPRAASNRRRLDSTAPYFTAYLRQQLVERYGACEGLLRRPRGQVDARPAAAGSGRRSGQLLPRLLAGDRLGGRDRQPQRRDQGDGRRPGLRHQALQPGDPGPPPAGLLDQALHPDHRARRGDLALHRLPLRRALLPLRQERQGNLRSHQRRGLLPRLLRHRLRDDLLGQLDLRRAGARRPEGQDGRATAPARSPATIHKAGYDDPISTNPAMVLGGLEEGVTPLGWAYAYSTIGNNGDRVSGTLAPRPGDSPVSYTQVTNDDGETIKGGDNDSIHDQVFDQETVEDSEEHPRNRRLQRHRHQRPDRRRRPVGQDGDDREQRRRLVLRRHRRRSHRLRLGRLPRHDDADDDALQRRPGDGRHLPGPDLGRVISAWQEIQAEHAAEKAARKAAKEAGEESEAAAKPKTTTKRRKAKATNRRRKPKAVEPAPEAEAEVGAGTRRSAGSRARRSRRPEAAPEGGGGGVTAG